jgi:WD40 repeat protein
VRDILGGGCPPTKRPPANYWSSNNTSSLPAVTQPQTTGKSDAKVKTDPAATRETTSFKHASPLVSCRFDPRGRFVFAGAQDNTVQRWDLATGKATSLAAHESWVRAIGFDRAGETLLTGGYDGRLLWWPLAVDAPAPSRTIEAHQGWVRAVAVSPDGTLAATGGNDRLVKLWRVADGSLVRQCAGHAKHVYSVAFHPAGQFLVSGDLEGVVKQWDVSTGSEVRTFPAAALHSYNRGQSVDYGGVRSMAFTADGKSLACAGLHEGSNPLGAVNEPLVLTFDWESAKQKQAHVTKEKLKGVAWRVVYHPDGFLIAQSGGSGGGFLIFYKPEEAQQFFHFKLPNTARDMDLHADGLRVATAHFDGTLRVWTMAPKAAG